ncbi:MAG: antitoxin family protein [Chloroflexi bacterium]|nr:antitoxin family protein [Chloroflexota bacterium]
MMSQPIRAVYSDGQLRLLDPVALSEGQEIQLVILSDADRVIAALGDLLVEIPDLTDENLNEEALAHEVENGFRGQRPLSEIIIEDRHEGP